MSTTRAPAADPARGETLPVRTKLAYGFGGVNEMFGHWLYASLARPVFNMHLGLSPTLVGAVLMFGRLADAFADVLFGWLSDNTRSRWGRRRPYLLAGSIVSGLALPCLFLASGDWDVTAPWMENRLFWFMLVSVLLFTPLIGLFSMPYASLGNELTPGYDERTSVIAYKAILQKIAGVAIAAAWWASRSVAFDPGTGRPDMLAGAQIVAGVAGLVMIVAGVVCCRGVSERYYEKARMQAKTAFWRTFREAFACRPFLVLLGVVVLVAVPTAVANDLGQYAGTYYVFGGDQDAMARYHAVLGVGRFLCGIAGVALATAAAKRFGKRKALVAALGAGIAAYGASWWLFAPGHPWLYLVDTSITVICSTGLWVLTPSMCADVVDHDELLSGQRREGAFNSWLSWVIKFGLAGAMLASGVILDATGFEALAGDAQTPAALWRIRFWFATIPVVALVAAGALLLLYPLGRARMVELRRALEARRGQV